MKRQKGFTLIEILIVVVIIAILAALILPRMLSQTERATIAEAQQMLGAIRRAQLLYQDLNGVSAVQALDSSNTTWNALGLKNPGTTSFTYTCVGSGTSCEATRVGSDFAGGKVIMNIAAGTFTCDGVHYQVVGGGNSSVGTNKGCMPKQ